MEKEDIILVAEPNEEHYTIINRNLLRAGIQNSIIRFVEAEQLLGFLMGVGDGPKRSRDRKYLLVLSSDMVGENGNGVLGRIKQDSELQKIPVIVFSDKDDQSQAKACHDQGCSIYITKPEDPGDFREAVELLGSFLLTVKIPKIDSV